MGGTLYLMIFKSLLDKTRLQYAENKTIAEKNMRVHKLWNGNHVLKHFDVTGPQVGKLVKLGQKYVRSALLNGLIPDTNEIVYNVTDSMTDYLRPGTAKIQKV